MMRVRRAGAHGVGAEPWKHPKLCVRCKQVLVVSAGRRELQEDRMELAAELTAAGLAVEYGCAAPPAARARRRAPACHR